MMAHMLPVMLDDDVIDIAALCVAVMADSAGGIQ